MTTKSKDNLSLKNNPRDHHHKLNESQMKNNSCNSENMNYKLIGRNIKYHTFIDLST